MKNICRVISSFFFLFICQFGNAQSKTNLTANEFELAINRDSIQLLDVRTPGEYALGHIKNAMLSNWNNANDFNRSVGFMDKVKPVYVYCLGGSRSAAAAAEKRTMGYKEVYELKGGINAWKAANKKIEGRTNAKQMSIDELKKAINGSKLVLVDFGAAWCPPCIKMEPVIKKLQKNYPNKFSLVKVDGGRDEVIMQKYQVTSLPVFILFKDGKQVWRKDGMVEEKEIADLFD